jgi:hypothetical protein
VTEDLGCVLDILASPLAEVSAKPDVADFMAAASDSADPQAVASVEVFSAVGGFTTAQIFAALGATAARHSAVNSDVAYVSVHWTELACED